MKAQPLKYWDRMRSSFWFIPSLMAIAAVALAFCSLWLDGLAADGVLPIHRFLYAGSPEGATAVLGTIAGSMITIAGVVFSMTLVALSLASSQFGPRLLRNFMRDNSNQVVLGTFVATFLYCLLALRGIQHGGDSSFVPHIAVNLAVLMALSSIGVLIYFIHHISLSIQADEIIALVGDELDAGIDQLFPQQIGRDAVHVDDVGAGSRGHGAPDSFEGGDVVEATLDGYLQIVDGESLIVLAQKADAVMRLQSRPGDYVVAGAPLVSVQSASPVEASMAADIRAAFVLGNQRSTAQDVEFCVQQLVEIAVRALSPGINDPFTAITCIDRLGSAYCRLARRDPPSAARADEHGTVRVVAAVVTFERMVDPALSMIRQSARANTAVTLRLLDAITVVAGRVRHTGDGDILRRHADLIRDAAVESLTSGHDRAAVERRHARAVRALDARAASS